ncbi:cupin domain-containing protein [Cyanobacteria bacterium FACHB-63]|nr:cupin domain-containing protein [Cyanobacteria bacterium FACHB-63]
MPVILNSQLPKHELPGLEHLTLAGSNQGIRSMEVWRQIIAPGVSTPVHQHPCEEVIVILTGSGEVVIDGTTEALNLDTTLIVPPNVVHQITNIGKEPMHLIGTLGMSPVRVYTAEGEHLSLPWDIPDSLIKK